jgi:hypothetical protein
MLWWQSEAKRPATICCATKKQRKSSKNDGAKMLHCCRYSTPLHRCSNERAIFCLLLIKNLFDTDSIDNKTSTLREKVTFIYFCFVVEKCQEHPFNFSAEKTPIYTLLTSMSLKVNKNQVRCQMQWSGFLWLLWARIYRTIQPWTYLLWEIPSLGTAWMTNTVLMARG